MHGVHKFVIDCLSIVLIDLLLAGDNALVIAMAVRPLSKRERRIGITFGAAGAVVLRVAITIVAAKLLTVAFIKLIGGALILWIAVKVMGDASVPPAETAPPRRFLQVIWFIVAADITMSTDNVLAIAGASHGNAWLIVFGLALSIPFVVFSSNLIAMLMDRYTVLIYLGVAILGRVGGEMMATDPFVVSTLNPSKYAVWTTEIVAIALVLFGGWILSRRAPAR